MGILETLLGNTLLGDATGDPYSMYGDLFNEKQKAALRDRDMSQGLLRMAGAFADAAKPTLMPQGGIGSAIGKAAAAMGAGGDEAMNQQLKAMQIAEQVKQTRQERAILAQALPIVQRIAQATGIPVADLIKAGGVPGAAPAAGAPAASPPAAGPAPAVPDPGGGLPTRFGLGPQPDRSQYGFPARPGAAPPRAAHWPAFTPPEWVPDAPGAGAGLGPLAPPDELVAQNAPGEGLLARIAAMQQDGGYGGGAPGGLPFRLASAAIPGAGGDDETGSGGGLPAPGDRSDAAWEVYKPIIKHYESRNRNILQQVVGPQGGYNPSVGRRTGPSTAGGFLQITDSTYRPTAAKLGIDLATYPRAIDAPEEVQDEVGKALFKARGLADWAPYNRPLARAVGWQGPSASGEGSGGGAAPSPAAGAGGDASAAPAPGGGLIPGTGVTPQALAALNAMLKLGGIKSDPFGSLLETYYKSPGYLGEKARTEAQATKDVDLQMGPQIKKAETLAELQAQIELKPKLEAAVAWAKIDPAIDEAQRKADIDRYTKMLEQLRAAGLEPTDVTVTFPGEDTPRKITINKAQLPELTSGKGIPALGLPPGTRLGEPVLSPEQTAAGTARGQASVNVNPFAFNLTPDPRMLPKGPGTTEPYSMPNGAVVPPVSLATPITGGADFLKKRQEQLAEAENEWGKGIAPAAQAEQRLMAIADALKQFQSGAFAGNLADVRAKLGAVGVRLPESIAGDPAEAQKILKNNFAASIELMRSTGLSRWTQAELFGAQQNMANPNLQPEANQAIIAEAVGAIRWERAMKESWAEAKKHGWRDPHDFQLQWTQANPLQHYVEQTRKDIGPLKGMAQPPSPGQPSQYPDGTIIENGKDRQIRRGGKWVPLP